MQQRKLGFFAVLMAWVMVLSPVLQGMALPAATPAVLAGTQHYTMIDLTPAGATSAAATAIANGQQVGSVGLGQPAVNHAFIWNGDASSTVDLGVGSAVAIGSGQQVGTVNGRAALWSGTPESFVDLNPGIYEQSAATGVANGQQVGWATRRAPCIENKGACGGGSGTSASDTMPTVGSQSRPAACGRGKTSGTRIATRRITRMSAA